MAQRLYWTAWRPQGEYKVELLKLRSMQCTNTPTSDRSEISSPPPGKSDIDVMADYFFKLYESLQTEVQQALGVELNKEDRIRYVISLPDDFIQEAKNAVHEAGIRAFAVDGEKHNLAVIAESEAAAVYATRNSTQASIGDMLLVVNCGGSHTDSNVLKIEQMNPFPIFNCIERCSDSCGSMTVNKNLSSIVEANTNHLKVLKGQGARLIRRTHSLCMEDFEGRIKAEFNNNRRLWAADVAIEFDLAQAHLKGGSMVFTNEEVRQCFDPVVDRILRLITNQIQAADIQSRRIRNIFLLGGFSASEWLIQQIIQGVPAQYQPRIVRSADTISAVMEGSIEICLRDLGTEPFDARHL
ncbi:hypothetical protein ASPWEDRAFT_33327 [Aspergillus wentii DTO 134E9]|uniref:Hydantoinase A/oxoprolinase domain-containing protein n=1 Tax=Aspergillus wentii DTO 134E9 TaxID=1073089 RepID=A0A1L9RYK6_ASPWE|nr:uncharacterized protein ASPWEDRAFT_33327 [Aspergillus wentii DTO 134E9]OJJ39983.1 hypothetical protein ASPWEDRAFT_33327 [Aspergillus wentii DTO 134E9]